MDRLEQLLVTVSNCVWGPPMLILLMGTHIFLTFRLKIIQRYLLTGIRLSIRRSPEGKGDISQYGALTTALAATIGTGNIVGVATAVAGGGPGAVLWMWLTGVFGIATKYAEALLAVKYRIVTPTGEMAGGPMYVLERGLKCRWLAVLFALFAAVTAVVIGDMVQANSIASLLHEAYNVPLALSGGCMMVVSAIVILGGIKSIAKVCEKLVPFMAVFYVGGCVLVLALNFAELPATIALIVKSAFSGQAAIAGFAGAGIKEAIRYGVARGLFSNESGLGSAPIAAAAAQTKNPVRQALISSTGTFWDTVVVCACTGLVVVSSGHWREGLNGAALTKAAFADIPYVGPLILTLGLLTFVFSTILGWCYYGEKAAEYLFGTKAILPYRILWVAGVMAGSLLSLPSVWAFADITNAMMVIPNVISLWALHRVLAAETKEYLWDGNLDKEGE